MSPLGTVLIIDDEDSLRHTLTRVLKIAGCEVSGAPDAPQALNLINTIPLDLVYLDIHLPSMNGLEVLQNIRTSHPDLPVILFTAHASCSRSHTAERHRLSGKTDRSGSIRSPYTRHPG